MNNSNQQTQSKAVNIDLCKTKANPTAIELFDKIDGVFQSPNMRYYLSEYDFGKDYNNDVLEPLNILYANYSNPNYHCIICETEENNMKFKKVLGNFLHFRRFETEPTNIGTYTLNRWHNKEYTIEERREKTRKFI